MCWRAFYSNGSLTYHSEPTGVVFGFLRGLNTLASQFGTSDFVFTFDYGRGWREQKHPFYKEERRKKRSQEEEGGPIHQMREQIDRLRTKYLEEIGHSNVFFKKGYEADDIMASVVAGLPDGDEAVLISGDKDLWQLLSRKVCVYRPVEKQLVTNTSFRDKYGVHPAEWSVVKAIAGCTSDEIPGLEGVGDILAAKYLAGDMKPTHKPYPRIKAFMESQEFRDNLSLVTIPYADGPEPLKTYRPTTDGPRDANAWRTLTEKLGMKSLADALEGDQAWRYVEPSNAS